MRFVKTAIFVSGVAALLAACSSTPVATSDAGQTAPATPAVAAAPAANTQAVTMVTPPYLDANSALSTKRSIYFDFDDFSVKKEFDSVLELHGKFLARNPGVAVKIEGNSDERGGAEYNLALGQKRAEAVVRALKVYGVKDSQLEATSWGEEKPKAAGHNEAAWSQNRRADVVYPKQ